MVAAMFTTIRITSAMRCYLNSSRLLAVGQTFMASIPTPFLVCLALTVRSGEAFRRHPQPNRPSSQNTNRKDSV